MPIECLHWRVAAIGAGESVQRPESAAQAAGEVEPIKTAQAYSTASGEVEDTPIYDVADLGVGAAVSGPAIVAAPTTTIVLHAGDVLERPGADGFLITVAPAAGAAGGARAEAVSA